MERIAVTLAGSTPTNFDSLHFNEELHQLISQAPETASSFTALLELPPTQALELLHSPETSSPPERPYLHSLCSNGFAFPANSGLVERAAKYSVFAAGESKAAPEMVKDEPVTESDNSNLNSSSQPLASDPMEESKSQKSAKRKEREKKGKGSTKKSKNESSESAEKLPYVHVRARRGQATDSHSLAERARREKINARMKLLQELVPGCNKISGTALVLDEIINHVQFLQRQVELLSMRLATVNPRINFNLDNLFATEENWQNGPVPDNTFPSMVMPLIPSELQFSGNRQQYQQQWHTNTLQQPMWGRIEDNHHFIATDNSLLSYDPCANSVSLHSREAENGAMKAE